MERTQLNEYKWKCAQEVFEKKELTETKKLEKKGATIYSCVKVSGGHIIIYSFPKDKNVRIKSILC